MSDAGIDAPYAIASFAPPFDREHGQVHSAPVCGWRGFKRRKRHEIVVAIDGEAVNIYNVQGRSLVASHPLPPQTYLCCPPCSIYRKSAPGSIATRKTFLVVREGAKSIKQRLLCITETVRSRKSALEFVAPARSECDLGKSPVLSLDVVPGAADVQFSVVINYKDGSVEMIDSDFSKPGDQRTLAVQTSTDFEVETAIMVHLEAALRGLLKGREDVIAQIKSSTSAAVSSHLLCRVVSAREERWIQLYTARTATLGSLRSSTPAMQLLMESTLPSPGKHKTSQGQYELHAASGRLYQLLCGRLNIFDLSGTVPRLAMRLGERSSRIKSFTRVSPNTVLAFTDELATLFETSFGAMQAMIALSGTETSASAGLKRKRAEDVETALPFPAPLALVDIGLVVGTSGHELLTIQLNDVVARGRSATGAETLLKDVRGRNIMHTLSGGAKREKKLKKWEPWMARVDSLIAEDDINELERFIANDRELGRQRDADRSMQEAADSSDEQSVDAGTYEDLWPLPEPLAPQNQGKDKALYLLSKVFGRSTENEDSIQVQIPSFKLLECLALAGVLTASYLRQALSTEPGQSLSNVRPGDVMTAISKIDDDFHLMQILLSAQVEWEDVEVVQALRLVIQSFDTASTPHALLALPAPPLPDVELPNDDLPMANGDIESESEIDVESKALENALDVVMNTLNTGLEVRSETLHAITRRLAASSQKRVTSLMRSMMSHSEIVFFIHILRIELADGGWTSQYVGNGEEDGQLGDQPPLELLGEEESRPNNDAIKAIGELLNCAIDAIGTSGWLVGLSGSALGTDALIENLKAEIGAGLEGCYEANTLRLLLRELERGAIAPPTRKRAHDVDADVVQSPELDLEMALLPLGPKPTAAAPKSKEHRKSRKMMAREKSRSVGKYAFERIRI